MRTFLVASLAMLVAGDGLAQLSTDRDAETDIRGDRQRLGPDSPPEPGPPSSPGFEIALTAPILFTDNAVGATGTTAGSGRRADGHFNPDLLLKWSRQFAALKLSASIDASVDRFFTETDQDEDTFFGGLTASFTDGRSDLFVPYLSYNVTADLRPDFGNTDDVLHSFSAGFVSAIAFRPGGGRITLREATRPGDRSLALDVSAGRRLADPRDFENTFTVATLDLSYVAASDWTFGLTPKLRVRWYDNFEGEFRRDYRLSGILRAAWTPAWLTRIVPAAEIDFTLSFLKNFSNLPRERFSQWEGGPALALAWRF